MHQTTLKLLKELIEMPSVFPREERIAVFCSNFLKKNGFDVELTPVENNRHNLIATKGSQKKCILLFGHLDTVPPYNYNKNPYKMSIKGDKISGLGSWDMKSGLAIIMSAASKIQLKGIGLKIVFSVDEENNSLGSHIVYNKKFLENVVLAITPEIIDDVDKSEDGNTILLGRRGRAVYEIEVIGIAGHGAALKGISAISVASEIIQFAERLKLKKDRFLGNCSIFIRKITGESTSLSLPEKCLIYLDVHYTPPYTQDNLIQIISKQLEEKFYYYLTKGVRISIRIAKRNTPYLKPYVTDRNNVYVKKVLSLLSNKIRNLKVSAGLTVADENIVGNFGVPVITIGPLGGGAHSSGEWVSKKSIGEIEKIYISTINLLTK